MLSVQSLNSALGLTVWCASCVNMFSSKLHWLIDWKSLTGLCTTSKGFTWKGFILKFGSHNGFRQTRIRKPSTQPQASVQWIRPYWVQRLNTFSKRHKLLFVCSRLLPVSALLSKFSSETYSIRSSFAPSSPFLLFCSFPPFSFFLCVF